MSEINIGDKVIVNEYPDEPRRISEIVQESYFPYRLNRAIEGRLNKYSESELTVIKENNMKYKIGDVFENLAAWCIWDRTVVATVLIDGEDYYITKDSDDGKLSVLDIEQLTDDWILKTEEVELTLDEIASKLNIDVKKLRIKD